MKGCKINGFRELLLTNCVPPRLQKRWEVNYFLKVTLGLKVPYHQLLLSRDAASESFAAASDCELELPIDVSLNHYLDL